MQGWSVIAYPSDTSEESIGEIFREAPAEPLSLEEMTRITPSELHPVIEETTYWHLRRLELAIKLGRLRRETAVVQLLTNVYDELSGEFQVAFPSSERLRTIR
jgi:hypothetical protein